ncbi:hypothetical protein EVAR_59899_1 [Eumeta japonica]|uniref:Endonuclease/exonuclease/phosphatase domain-containing protein n=1 Tax=Eumeta variegata TaxID=151549 RepID=A0A4C2AGX6_EUMVA|nr:hypothetical protein EVAR_59899_1 [Eumeta japonica]
MLRAARLNEGNTPTFEVYRGPSFRSVVDVIVRLRSTGVEEWQVVRDVTSSDHNAVTSPCEWGSGPVLGPTGTRVYNTAKARWSEFAAAMDAAR